MLDLDLLWHPLRMQDASSIVPLVLTFLSSAALGATLASLVTWIEEHLTTVKEAGILAAAFDE
jgi:hypothetical protein